MMRMEPQNAAVPVASFLLSRDTVGSEAPLFVFRKGWGLAQAPKSSSQLATLNTVVESNAPDTKRNTAKPEALSKQCRPGGELSKFGWMAESDALVIGTGPGKRKAPGVGSSPTSPTNAVVAQMESTRPVIGGSWLTETTDGSNLPPQRWPAINLNGLVF